MTVVCPICKSSAQEVPRTGDATGFHCPTHGDFKVADAVFAEAKAKDYTRDMTLTITPELLCAGMVAHALFRSAEVCAALKIKQMRERAVIFIMRYRWPGECSHARNSHSPTNVVSGGNGGEPQWSEPG